MRAIDFRLRPPYKSYLNSFMYDMPALEKSHAMRAIGPVSEAARRKNTAMLVEEMDKAGVTWGVAPVRLPQNASNDDAVTLMEEFPDHFLGVPWIDPLNPQAPVRTWNVTASTGRAVPSSWNRDSIPRL